MVQPQPSQPIGGQSPGKLACPQLPEIVDNCAHSRLLLMVMEYFFMSGADTNVACECPMLRCRKPCDDARQMIDHLKTCECLNQEEMWCPCGCRQWFRFSAITKKECSWSYNKPTISQRIGDCAHRLAKIKSKSKHRETIRRVSSVGSDACTVQKHGGFSSVRSHSPCNHHNVEGVQRFTYKGGAGKFCSKLTQGPPVAGYLVDNSINNNNNDDDDDDDDDDNNHSTEMSGLGLEEMDAHSIPSKFTSPCDRSELSTPMSRSSSDFLIPTRREPAIYQNQAQPKSPLEMPGTYQHQQELPAGPCSLQALDHNQTVMPSANVNCRLEGGLYPAEMAAVDGSLFCDAQLQGRSSPLPVAVVPNYNDQDHPSEWWRHPVYDDTTFNIAELTSPDSDVRPLYAPLQGQPGTLAEESVLDERLPPESNLPTPLSTRSNSGRFDIMPTLNLPPAPVGVVMGEPPVLFVEPNTGQPRSAFVDIAQLAVQPVQNDESPTWSAELGKPGNPLTAYPREGDWGVQAQLLHIRPPNTRPRAQARILCPKSAPPDHCSYVATYNPGSAREKRRAEGNCRRHIQRKHSGQNWVCHVCSMACTRRDNLLKHLQKHPSGADVDASEEISTTRTPSWRARRQGGQTVKARKQSAEHSHAF